MGSGSSKKRTSIRNVLKFSANLRNPMWSRFLAQYEVTTAMLPIWLRHLCRLTKYHKSFKNVGGFSNYITNDSNQQWCCTVSVKSIMWKFWRQYNSGIRTKLLFSINRNSLRWVVYASHRMGTEQIFMKFSRVNRTASSETYWLLQLSTHLFSHWTIP